MDPLSEVLSLLKLQTYRTGGFVVSDDAGFAFQAYQGLKCYAVVAGACWITVEGQDEPVHMRTGDCFLLPTGRPFRIFASPTAACRDFDPSLAVRNFDTVIGAEMPCGFAILGGHFLLTAAHADVLLGTMPTVVSIRTESNKAAMRWSLNCLREELQDPQPGGSLVAQQVAYIMLVQALRVHQQNEAATGIGWLFALADPQLRIAITCMHESPAHPWTLQELAERAGMSRTVFAQAFRRRVGMTSMDYLTRWRMLLAGDRLKRSDEPVSKIAWTSGYETESAFSKAFRRVLGCSPREYRLGPPKASG